MKYLVNFSNQLGAGPRMIAKEFIEESKAHPHDFVFLVPRLRYFENIQPHANVRFVRVGQAAFGSRGLFSLVFVNFFLMPILLLRERFDGVIAFGNFMPIRFMKQSAVLMHHPYVVDNALLKSINRSAF